MKKKIYYWGPFIDKVATVKAIINSAKSINKYSSKYKASIIDATGEWEDIQNDCPTISFINLNLKNKSK